MSIDEASAIEGEQPIDRDKRISKYWAIKTKYRGRARWYVIHGEFVKRIEIDDKDELIIGEGGVVPSDIEATVRLLLPDGADMEIIGDETLKTSD